MNIGSHIIRISRRHSARAASEATPVVEDGRAISSPPVYRACGVPIHALTMDSAANRIAQAASLRTGLQVHLCNSYTLSLLRSTPGLKAALEISDLNLPDGTPLAWLGRGAGTHGPVRGPGLVALVVATDTSGAIRHFLLGGQNGAAESMANRLKAKYPNARVVGTLSPPMQVPSDSSVAEFARAISAADATLVWIGLGTPKQDLLVPRLAALLPHVTFVPVGAAFDFWSGRVPEAPRWLHGSGLEWLYRLTREPRRLWRRYLFGNLRFIVLLVQSRASERRSSRPK